MKYSYINIDNYGLLLYLGTVPSTSESIKKPLLHESYGHKKSPSVIARAFVLPQI